VVGKIFRVIFSRKSSRKLRGISDHLTENASSSVAANVTSEIRKEALKLEKLPGSKPTYPGTEDLEEDIRYTKKWSYKIIFEVLNPKNIVRILTVRHDAEDPEDILDDLQ
jgi:plasmid stabilization system protein ParE